MTNLDGTATKSSSAFRMECGVAISIAAPADRVWALLTNAADFPKWNTTVKSIEGSIAPGQRIALRVPDVDRVFKLTVSAFDPPRRMVWQDGTAPMFKGVRTYTLSSTPSGTNFSMVEVFAGLMLPMIKGSLPDFGPAFERYARDLKAAAERA